ncbi:MAG: hypothetical protein RMI04_09060 [Thermofilaceae archaeon]|nr:hypothetical protein [Thermofilaceae archaeon]
MSMGVSERTVIVGHFDVHGITAAYLAAKAFNATEVFANYPQTSPENLVSTLQNLYAAAPAKLRLIIVDVPVDLKNPTAFVQGLENLAARHEILFMDHHESSIPYLPQFKNVRTIILGPSALTLNNFLLSQISNATENDKLLSVVGAVADRDPEVIRRGVFSQDIQALSDGLDVLVREKDGALTTLRRLVSEPTAVINEARARVAAIPSATLSAKVGVVAVANALPEGWGPKALERLAFAQGAWYAVGHEFVTRNNQWIVRAIQRWDIAAKMSHLVTPGAVARELWPTRNVIGHPAAPSVAATTEGEAREMALQWARAISEKATAAASPVTAAFISESNVGIILAEILQRMEKMYEEYLELKRKQVELLERATRSTTRYD